MFAKAPYRTAPEPMSGMPPGIPYIVANEAAERYDRSTVVGLDMPADEKLEAVRKICLEHGHEVENTLPKVLYGGSFFPMTTAIGPQGERWAPVHGIVPVGDAPGALAKLEALGFRVSPLPALERPADPDPGPGGLEPLAGQDDPGGPVRISGREGQPGLVQGERCRPRPGAGRRRSRRRGTGSPRRTGRGP